MLELKQIPRNFQEGCSIKTHKLCGQKDLDLNLGSATCLINLTSLNFGFLIFKMGIKSPTSRGTVGKIDEIK